jgi:hypothetical protein
VNRLLLLAAAALLAGCTQAQIKQSAADAQVAIQAWAPVAGQLFCAIQKNGGGAIIVGVVNAAVASASPGAEPIALVITGVAKTFVDQACDRAAVAANATAGFPVVPPPAAANGTVTVPRVAIVPPTEGTAP